MKIFDLVFEFMQIMIRTYLARTHAVICFCESAATNYLRRFGTAAGLQISAMVCLMQAIEGHKAYTNQVVEDTSAILPGVHCVILDSDHLNLNKFASTRDGNYIRVSSNLARIAAQAPGPIRSRQRGQFPESVVAQPSTLLIRVCPRCHGANGRVLHGYARARQGLCWPRATSPNFIALLIST